MIILKVAYILIWILMLFLATVFHKENDKKNEFKINNYLVAWLVMAFFIPNIV